MIVKEEFLSKLRTYFSLNLYEVKIWTALLSRGVATAGELSDIANVPRSRSYDVLESLEKKGFIIMKIGKPIKYIAVQPETILERVKSDLKDEARRQTELMEAVRDTDVFRELELLHKSGVRHVDPTEMSNSLVGRDSINRQIKAMLDNAESSVVIATTQDGFRRKAKILRNYMPSFRRKGISVKMIAPVDSLAAKKVEGAELKDMDAGMRFVNIDNKEILFLLGNEQDPEYDMGVWLQSEFFVNGYSELFHQSLE